MTVTTEHTLGSLSSF